MSTEYVAKSFGHLIEEVMKPLQGVSTSDVTHELQLFAFDCAHRGLVRERIIGSKPDPRLWSALVRVKESLAGQRRSEKVWDEEETSPPEPVRRRRHKTLLELTDEDSLKGAAVGELLMSISPWQGYSTDAFGYLSDCAETVAGLRGRHASEAIPLSRAVPEGHTPSPWGECRACGAVWRPNHRFVVTTPNADCRALEHQLRRAYYHGYQAELRWQRKRLMYRLRKQYEKEHMAQAIEII
jgi:hypothetical protein